MKEKKGKKSLRDVDNLVVKRSTRLKELSESLLTSNFGANINSISTTSYLDLPPSLYMVNDSIKMCEFVGRYYKNVGVATTSYSYDTTNLTYVGGGSQSAGGWYILNDGYKSRTGISNNNYTFDPFKGESGYLFVFFFRKNEENIINRVCSNCYKDASQEGYPNICKVFDTNQGKIFAVLIQNIIQINELNQTFASQSNGVYLSDVIKNAINGNSVLNNFIKDIRNKNNDYTTPIISPINPIEWNGNTFDINFNSYTIYPTEFQSTSIYINLKDLVTPNKFVNGFMGSGKFTVNRLAGVNGNFTPFSLSVLSYKPKIFSTSILNINANELPVFVDDTSITYVQIMKPPTSFSTDFYRPQFLNFTLLLTQPFYYTTGEFYYLEKTIGLGFRVIF
jgi:hypothetical protein